MGEPSKVSSQSLFSPPGTPRMYPTPPFSGHFAIKFSAFHNFTFRRRRALVMTETELKLIAAPAMIGLSSQPKNG